MEIKTVMAMLCSGFDVSKPGHFDDNHRVTELFSFTMMPRNLFVRFQRRGNR